MTMKKIFLAALTGTALLAAAPVFADNGRGGRQDFRGDHRANHFQGDRGHQFRGDHFRGEHFRGGYFQRQPVVAYRPAYGYYRHRPVIVDRPAYGYYAPRHDLLGGLILGTVIGAAIVNHNSY